MAKIVLCSYKVEKVKQVVGLDGQKDWLVTISFGIGTGPPFPDETVEAKNVAECKAALDAYAEKAKATGLPLQVNARIARGERKPNGFDKANLKAYVNLE